MNFAGLARISPVWLWERVREYRRPGLNIAGQPLHAPALISPAWYEYRRPGRGQTFMNYAGPGLALLMQVYPVLTGIAHVM